MNFVGYRAADSSSVAPVWQYLPMVVHVLLGALATATSFCVAYLVNNFDGRCLFYATLRVQAIAGSVVHFEKESVDHKWGDMYTCSLAQYLPLFVFTFAAVWLYMFFVCGRGGSGSTEGFSMHESWRLVFPALLFHLAMSVGALVCAVYMSHGAAVFCNAAAASLSEFSCNKMDQYKFSGYPNAVGVGTWLFSAITMSWAIFGCLLFVTVLLMARCLWRPDLTPIYSDNIGYTPIVDQY